MRVYYGLPFGKLSKAKPAAQLYIFFGSIPVFVNAIEIYYSAIKGDNFLFVTLTYTTGFHHVVLGPVYPFPFGIW